ncbi:MAG TPA: thioredoxin TrxC [Methylococcaceae bacterium]|nr:thioredoxin TrxC [Methylococcaceae bacterium]
MTEALHIACPHCQTINRLPVSHLEDKPTCGRCRKPLFEGRPLAFRTVDFDRFAARSDIPLVVDFWAPWCGPCRMMTPAFDQAAALLEPGFRLGKVNTEEEPAIAARFGIRSIPTLAIFRHGREVARQTGALGVQDIVRWVQGHA